jgi:hypothetical protein
MGRRPLLRLLGALIVLASILTGCGGGSPGDAREEAAVERVAVRWLKEMGHGELRAACRLMDAEKHRAIPGHSHWDGAENCRQRWLHSDNTPFNWKPKPGAAEIYGDDDPEVLEVVLEGDEATVYVRGAGTRRPLWLISEGGRWLVDSVEYPI